jgi:hypothetical protein
VFIGSPNDVSDERIAARQSVEELNDQWSWTGFRIELVLWEDTVAGVGRPQELINRDLEKCDLFIGVLWKRWGSPPARGGAYTSGFEEEFRISAQKAEAHGRPQIGLFFKKIDVESLRDPGDQLRRVVAFREDITAGKRYLFEEFGDTLEFERKFRRCVTAHLRALIETDRTEEAVRSQPAGITQESDVSEPTPSLLSQEGSSFANRFLSSIDGADDHEQIRPEEVARFRLLGTLVSAPGNDDVQLGVHDANLLYVKTPEPPFGATEVRGLLRAGLAHFNSEVAPVWRWLKAADGFQKRALLGLSLPSASSAAVAVGALKAMSLLREPLPTEVEVLEVFMNAWLGPDASPEVKVTALEYLGQTGGREQLIVVRSELDRNDSATSKAALDSFLRIQLRAGFSSVLEALIRLQPERVPDDIAQAISAQQESLTDSELNDLVQHRSRTLRVQACEELFRRSGISKELARKLLEDADLAIRLLALKSLVSHGEAISRDFAKQVLVKPREGIGLLSRSVADLRGADAFEEFEEFELRSVPLSQLRARSGSLSLGKEEYFVLADRGFQAEKARLRAAVDDRFEHEYEKIIGELVEDGRGGTTLVTQAREIESFVRKKYTRRAVNILSKHRDRADLARLRSILRSHFVETALVDIEYFQRHGTFEDIDIVLDFVRRGGSRADSALLIRAASPDEIQVAARVVMRLAGRRIADVFGRDIPVRLKLALLSEISSANLSAMSDESLIAVLNDKSDDVRRLAALRFVRSLPAARIATLLRCYLSLSTYYYNVVHWLDLGISAPSAMSKSVARSRMER